MTEHTLMQQSPFDNAEQTHEPFVQLTRRQGQLRRFVPSRFNARATAETGELVLWNSRTGAMSAFTPAQRPAVERRLSRQGIEEPLAGLTKYLFDRGFLIPAELDEYRDFQLAFGEQHYRQDTLQLILLASEDCNFRCEYCYEDFARGTMLPSVREGVKRLVERRAPQLTSLSISWFGGEPLYGLEAVRDLAPHLLHIAREHNLVYSTHMTTNGYLLTPEVAADLLAWEIRDFQITLDGPAASHDRKRHGRDNSPTFDVIMNNLRALHTRDEQFVVTIRVNFDRENHPHLEAFLDTLRNEFDGDPRFRVWFHAVGKWGGANDENLNTCSGDESRAVQDRLRREARRRGIPIDGSLKDNGAMGKSVCYAARPFNFVVGADGKLMKCTVVLDKEEHNIVGRITPEGELELDRGRLAVWVEPAFSNDAGCQACHLVPMCQGMSCPLVRLEEKRRPCVSAKRHGKSELLVAFDEGRREGRVVAVRNA